MARKPGARACDRGCLIGIADAYLAALAAHDPSKAPMAPAAKFTEQAVPLAVGEGLWKTTTEAPTTFKIAVPDPVVGEIGLIVMMKANLPPAPAGPAVGATPAPATPGPVAVQLGLRLKVENREIVEAEHVVARITNSGQLANLQEPRPGLLAMVPPAERSPRDLMLLIGNSYYDAIVQSNGEAAPFAADCGWRENGMHTAGVGAPPPAARPWPRHDTDPGVRRPVDLARDELHSQHRPEAGQDRRPGNGAGVGMTMFRHPFDEKFVTLLNPDGSTTRRPMNYNPFDFEAVHIFKVRDRKIHEIEAMGITLPYLSKNGWSQFLR